MTYKYNLIIIVGIILVQYYASVKGRGILILYRPKDITVDCAFSKTLRYDLSFGMGMSDTITVILRTLPDVDYECQVDITTDRTNKLVVVIRFPTTIGFNCEHNPHAFYVMKYDHCLAVCDEDELEFQDIFSKYWVIFTQGRFRFQFKSNSRINLDLNAHVYEVTVTTARLRGNGQSSCLSMVNETECFAPYLNEYYCMTSGIVCDGVKNCGAEDWYDERKSDCEVPTQRLEYSPILAVLSLILFVYLAIAQVIKQCLPRATNFFIYRTNEDNRLCIDPVFKATVDGVYEDTEDFNKDNQLIPDLLFDSSECSDDDEPKIENLKNVPLTEQSLTSLVVCPPEAAAESKITAAFPILSVSERISKRLRSAMGQNLRLFRETSTPFLNPQRLRRETENLQEKHRRS